MEFIVSTAFTLAILVTVMFLAHLYIFHGSD